MPDIMEYFPADLYKEHPGVEIENVKVSKPQTIKASTQIIEQPINSYFKWN